MSVVDSGSVRSRRRKAALVAVGTFGWLFLVLLVEKVMGLIAFASSAGLYELNSGVYFWSDVPYRVGTFMVPVAVGLFLGWAFLAPVTSPQELRTVVTRSIVATGVASALYLVVRLVVDIALMTWPDRSFFANSFPDLDYAGSAVPMLLGSSLQGAISVILSIVPLGVLGGILLWHWLKRDAPTREGVV